MYITSKFLNCDPISFAKSLLEVANDFSYESLHWCNIDHFEVLEIKGSVVPSLLRQHLHDGKQGNVSLSSTSRGADKQVLISSESSFVDLALDIVEIYNGCGEGSPCPLRHLRNCDKLVVFLLELMSDSRHVNLFITNLCDPLRPFRQHALLVSH